MKIGITALGGLASVVALVLILNLATSAGGGSPVACSQAGDGPPPGVNTPNATVLAGWRTAVHESGVFYTPTPGGFEVQGDGSGTPDVSGLKKANWGDPQPAQELPTDPGIVVGGAGAPIDVPCD